MKFKPGLLQIFYILFIGWVFFVLVSFFAVQKPFTGENALAVGRVLLDLLTAGWLVLIGLGLGSRLLDRLLPGLSLGETVIAGSGLGLGGLGLFSLVLSLLGLFQTVIIWSLTLLLSLVALPRLGSLFRQWRRAAPTFAPSRPVRLYLWLMVIFTLLTALLPPTDWDGLFYHLTGPRLYLQAGGLQSGIDLPHLNFPSLMEMLYTWAMLLRSDIAAKLLHTVFALLLAGLIYLTTHRFLAEKAAWPAVLVFTSMPMVSTLAGWAYNDLALAFYQLAALYALLQWRSDRSNRSWLILSGLFTGLAMGMKYTAFVTPLVISGLILWDAGRHHRPAGSRAYLAGLVLFALVALLAASPWYAKNQFFTGNPVYPFLFDLFGGRFWDSFRADWYAAAGTGIGFQIDTLLALPWLLTLGVRDVNYWDGRTGPLLLLFLPPVVLYGLQSARRRSSSPDSQSPIPGPLLLYSLAHFVFWTLGVIWSRSLWQSRLLLPGLTALTPVIGWVWSDLGRFDRPHFSLQRFINITVALVLALTVIDVGLLTLKIDPLPYLVGLESRDQYLGRRLGAHYAAMQQINQKLPPEAVVVFLWEPRSYYCQRDCRPDSILDRFPHLVYQYHSAAAIARAWQQAGVTHILIHRSGLNFILNESPEVIDRPVLEELEQQWLEPVLDIGGAYQVYKLGK